MKWWPRPRVSTTAPVADRAGDHVAYLDWLKFLVVYGIVIYHVALPFSATSWLINSHDRNLVLSAFTGFTFPWGIPLMFLLSGAGAYFGLRRKSASAFFVLRVVRLGLPLVAGLLILSPLQSYFISGGSWRTWYGLLVYYPRFLGSVRIDWEPLWLGHYGYQLWFLGYLLAISVATLPLLEWLRRDTGRRWVARAASFSHKRGGLLVFVVPLVLSQLWLRNRYPNYEDWADIATYAIVFVAGFIMAADRDFDLAIRKNAGLMLRFGIVSTLAVGALVVINYQHLIKNDPLSHLAFHFAFGLFWSLNIWSWCVAVLYLGVRWLNSRNALVRYGAESALPVYVISHPVVIIAGSFIVFWSLPLYARFAILLITAFAGTLCIYEFGVRRWNPTRFVFGLKPLSKKSDPEKPSTSNTVGANAPVG